MNDRYSWDTRVAHTLLLSACALSALLVSRRADAQLQPQFELVRDEFSSSAGVDVYAGLNSAARSHSERSNDRLGAALGGHLAAEAWAWSETSKMATETAGAEGTWSVWPLFGTKWGVEGGGFLGGHLLGCLACGEEQLTSAPFRGQASQWARLRSGVVNLVQTAHYQRPAEFDDIYWRAERDVTSLGFGVELPFTLRFENEDGLTVNFQKFSIYGRRLIDVSNDSAYANLEFDVSTLLLEVIREHEHSSFVGEFIGVDFNLFGAPELSSGTRAYMGPFAVRVFLADMRGITFDDGENTFGLRVGINIIEPGHVLGTIEEQIGQEDEQRASPFQPDLMVWFASRAGERRGSLGRHRVWRALHEVSYQIGAGTFYRIGPTGFGVDEGWKLELDGAVPLSDRWSVRAEAVGVTAQRTRTGRVVEDMDVPRTGSRFLMGRAEVGATGQLGERLMLDLSLWGERSDRYDPSPQGFSDASPGELTFSLGAAASVTAKIF